MTQRSWRRPPGSPTLTQIARAAGVPVPVVSKVLNGRSDVSPSVRESVAAQLRLAGYTPVAPVKIAAPNALLDLVVSAVEGTWANVMLSGIEGAASETGLDVVVVLAREGAPEERDWVQRLIDRGSKGAVVALVAPTTAEYRRLTAAGIELVALDPYQPISGAIPTVGASHWTGGRQAAEHLIALGHERFAVVAGTPRHQYSQARVDGFRSALASRGLASDTLPVGYGDWRRTEAAEAARVLLDHPDRPTAVFACSDRMALGVFDAAAERGLRIPRDLSVVGFDDLPEARWLSPGLTTVRQPVREMAELAARTLLRLIAGERLQVPRVELQTRLVVRGSTSACRAGAGAPADDDAED
jgi:LacI family transcriptional regulator